MFSFFFIQLNWVFSHTFTLNVWMLTFYSDLARTYRQKWPKRSIFYACHFARPNSQNNLSSRASSDFDPKLPRSDCVCSLITFKIQTRKIRTIIHLVISNLNKTCLKTLFVWFFRFCPGEDGLSDCFPYIPFLWNPHLFVHESPSSHWAFLTRSFTRSADSTDCTWVISFL